MQRFIKYNSKLKEKARVLRKNMTEPEKKIWFNFLRTFKDNYNIRVLRQRPIDQYIVDFYIPEYKIVIEIDGETHYDEKGIFHDKIRTQRLNFLGIKVLRYTNLDIMRNFNGVCEEILMALGIEIQ